MQGDFATWLDDLGMGRLNLRPPHEDYVDLPTEWIVNSDNKLIEFVYGEAALRDPLSNTAALWDGAILAPTNKAVNAINEKIMKVLTMLHYSDPCN